MRSDLHSIKAIFFAAGATLIHLDSSRFRDLLSLELSIEMSFDGLPRAQSLAMARLAELVADAQGRLRRAAISFNCEHQPDSPNNPIAP